VQVSRVDLDGRRIDFRLVRDGEPELPGSRQRGERARKGGAVEELADVNATERALKAGARKKARAPSAGASSGKAAKAGRGKSAPRTRR
jgi:ribonuclease R